MTPVELRVLRRFRDGKARQLGFITSIAKANAMVRSGLLCRTGVFSQYLQITEAGLAAVPPEPTT